jgi:hypothetical protein
MAAIWRYLLDVDWMGSAEASLVPPDHPLFLLVATPRRMRYRMGDALWVRLVDVGAALAGRTYVDGGPLVLEVRDAVCEWNDGRWRLEGGACERTDEDPDLALDAAALGSAYLGAVSFTQLREALRVEELRDGASERADALFAWRPLPWCPKSSEVCQKLRRSTRGSLNRGFGGAYRFRGRRRTQVYLRSASSHAACADTDHPQRAASAYGARGFGRGVRAPPWGLGHSGRRRTGFPVTTAALRPALRIPRARSGR